MQEYQEGNVSHKEFILMGFSGLKGHRQFLFIPFLLLFLLSLFGNSLLIISIKTRRTLHSPMYMFICATACVDLTLPILFVPKMLLGFLFDWNKISLLGCLVQMFFVHFFGSFQSTVLLWMALDRYVAICIPLRYNDYINSSAFFKLSAIALLRNGSLVLVVVILAGSLSFCLTNVIDHCFCEHMALVSLACGNTARNSVMGLLAVFCVAIVDGVFIAISYVKIFLAVSNTASGKSRQKAIHTCGTQLMVISVSYIFAMTAFLAYRIKNSLHPDVHVLISIMYLLFPSCFHPIIYGIRTKEIREQMLNILHYGKIVPISVEP
ncbi:olfactory receptor 52K1-like [Lepisosteus oculatus]|uniref:olfactory receptor 52K1-like n=1 Tax=Lepisosteus oculatus TaxID=7918 RepID=UPI003713472A